jgi:hypothetical protein
VPQYCAASIVQWVQKMEAPTAIAGGNFVWLNGSPAAGVTDWHCLLIFSPTILRPLLPICVPSYHINLRPLLPYQFASSHSILRPLFPFCVPSYHINLRPVIPFCVLSSYFASPPTISFCVLSFHFASSHSNLRPLLPFCVPSYHFAFSLTLTRFFSI